MADEIITLDGVQYTYHRVNGMATITALALDGQANVGGVLSIPFDAARAMFAGLRAAANYRRIARNRLPGDPQPSEATDAPSSENSGS